jgi:3-oxoacyl-[acyl-carrier-protein] synthase-3
VLNLGLSKTLGILYGTASIAVSLGILLIDIALGEPIGIAMFIDAVVVGKSDAPTLFNVKVNGDARFLGIDRGGDNCPYHAPGEPHKLFMNGQVIYKFAVSAVSKCVEELAASAGISEDEIGLYFLHQANMRIIDSAIRQLKQPEEKFPHNIQHYGNTSSASIPLLLDEENRKGTLCRGQRIVLCAFGAGLASAGCLLEW